MNAPASPRRLVSPGPIADAFLASQAFFAIIIGPVGSAKTVTALQKGIRNGALQGGVVDQNGVTFRRARAGVVRESYPNLEANTLPSWFNIVPEEEGKFSWKAPYTHRFRKVLRREGNERGGRPIDVLDMEFEFRAIGDKSVEAITRGWEINVLIVDEADLQPADLISYGSGRVGRFANMNASLVREPQIILSSNAPYTDNWLYKLAVEKDLGELDGFQSPELIAALEGRPLIETFIQPGGLAPGAENLHNLRGGVGYYHLQVAANKHRPGYVDRMVHNKFVPMQHGQPVYPQFNFVEHAVDRIEYDPRRMLVVGVDQGLFAAAVLTQRTVMGEFRSLGEVVLMQEEGKSLRKIGPTAFGKMLKTAIVVRCPEIRAEDLKVVLDPAAFAATDREDDEQDWVKAFQAALGFRVHRAKSNREQLRLEAVRKALSERNGYQVDKSCKNLIRGHLGGYRYRKGELTEGETRGHLEIADTIFTHVCDAEQYAAIEGEHVIGDIRGQKRRDRAPAVDSGDDYFAAGDW